MDGSSLPTAREPGAGFGILVLDAAGEARFSAGEGDNPALRTRLRELAAIPGRALHTVRLGEQERVVLCWPSGDGTLFVIHEARDCHALLDFIVAVDFAYPLLNHMLTDRFEAVTVVDRDARIRYISPVHEAFFGLAPGEATGRHVQSVIENTRLHHVVRSGRAEIGQIQEMRGVSRVVARTPIFQGEQVIGAMGRVMFKGPEQVLALSRKLADLRSELALTRRRLSPAAQASPLEMIIGDSPAIRQLKSDLARVAPLDVAVLLVGESGTGKELAAHALHALGPRAAQAMVTVNAAAMPTSLIESEMFGYETGAFTGAERRGRRGKFELADRSTLFLDEIGDMPLEVQAKLLRVLQDKTFERVGGEQPRRSDFRLVCATNRDLDEMTRQASFRLDLYYRISTVVLHLPPLRERLEDIRPIVDDFIVSQRRVTRVHLEVYDYLAAQSWPGNVRQLLHEVEKATIFADGAELTRADFRAEALVRSSPRPAAAANTASASPAAGATAAVRASARAQLHDSTLEVAQTMVREALQRCGGNKRRVAQELGISRSYLYRLLQSMPQPGS